MKFTLLLGLTGIGISACPSSIPPGMSVYSHPGHLILQSGDTLKVYRVSYVTYIDKGPDAVAFEYEAPFPIDDPREVIKEAKSVWPYAAPYVEAQNVGHAVLVLSNYQVTRYLPWRPQIHVKSFPLVVSRGTDGRWRMAIDSASPLPAVDAEHPHVIDQDGTPLPFLFPHTGDHACRSFARPNLICV